MIVPTNFRTTIVVFDQIYDSTHELPNNNYTVFYQIYDSTHELSNNMHANN
jgi:hypothetical protein